MNYADPADPMTGNGTAAPEQGAERPAPVQSADAGTDESIAERLERNPQSAEARLDRGLDESMDASDPPASTQPVHAHATEPPESSGFNAKAEKKLARGEPGLLERIAKKIGLG